MKNKLEALVRMSRKLGQDKNQILAAGGNTSYKEGNSIWVKGSGTELGNIDINGFVECDRRIVESNLEKTYNSDPDESFKQARIDLLSSMIDPEYPVQPSVETSIHVLLKSPYVAHTHPTLVNALTSSKNGENLINELFSDEAIFVDYNYPGFALFSKVKKEIDHFREINGKDPGIIFLKNHGIVLGGKNTEEIDENFARLFHTLEPLMSRTPNISTNNIASEKLDNLLPALRMMLSNNSPVILKFQSHSLIDYFTENRESFKKIQRPFCFDHVKHGGGRYLYLNHDIDSPDFFDVCEKEINKFHTEQGLLPKVILIKGIGLIVASDTARDSETLMNIFEDQLKISYLSENFGGPEFLPDEEIKLIQTRLGYGAVEKPDVHGKKSIAKQSIAIVTGGAQGFGEGIVRDLFAGETNIVIADLNEDTSNKLLMELNHPSKPNKAIFVKTDVSDPDSVKNLISETVREFGGLDIMISNAGVLFAGGLDEMDPEVFDLVTRVNYKGYFLCAKYSSAVMKLQSRYKSDHYSDIIQINSKSGLKGSNKNFAYAGGKFGGIGLTQSFALELIPFRIKVNSIAPGNLFDGPLWSDPENGLFVQYLHAGKVPGAKTISDVKKFYEAQVPANRGCTVDDVMKAIYYAIDQKYETGQAIPVTGGQIMLS
jgi:NAD(P)-dependent dehydrogenase (short-subunit alcohol dehydrogenase family)/rhamnose utilization protein RhaD (predicted bifunctional aldolase and dehydrogenase)